MNNHKEREKKQNVVFSSAAILHGAHYLLLHVEHRGCVRRITQLIDERHLTNTNKKKDQAKEKKMKERRKAEKRSASRENTTDNTRYRKRR